LRIACTHDRGADTMSEQHEMDLWLIRKSGREQTSPLAQRALWGAVKRIVRAHMHRDGFVDWHVIEPIIDKHFDDEVRDE
jgi:hypothetical protein